MRFLPFVALAALGGAVGSPTVDAVASSARYEIVSIPHGDGYVETLAMMIVTVQFTEDLYVMYKGNLTRIDELPVTPETRTFSHPHDQTLHSEPFYTWPLNTALGGTFRITAAEDSTQCEGFEMQSMQASHYMVFKNYGDDNDQWPEITGMPPIGEMGKEFFEGGPCPCDGKTCPCEGPCGDDPSGPGWAEGYSWQNRETCPLNPHPVFANNGGCNGKPDFTACPAWSRLDWMQKNQSHRSMFCLADQCVGSVTAYSRPSSYALVFPSTQDSGFTMMNARIGGMPLTKGETKPNQLKVGFVLPYQEDDSWGNPFWWLPQMQFCGLTVRINDLTEASSMFGIMSPGEYPFTPNRLTGSDGSLATGKVTFASGRAGYFESLLDTAATCNNDDYQAVMKRMEEVVDDFKQANSLDELRALRKTVNAFIQSPGLRLCKELQNSFVRSSAVQLEIGETAYCVHPEYDNWDLQIRNPLWDTDCKCNRTLQASQCCTPAPALRNARKLDEVLDSRVESLCGTEDQALIIKRLLNDVVGGGETSQGFREEDFWQVQETVRQEQRAFMEDCESLMHNKVCSVPGDCLYGTVCETQHSDFKCRIRSANRLEPYLQCYLHKLDSDGPRQLFASNLGVPNFDECPLWIGEPGQQANTSLPCYQTMLAAFEAQYSKTECEGENAHLYHEKWVPGVDEWGHETHIRIPTNESGCLSEEYCVGDDNWPRTTFPAGDMSSLPGGECPGQGVDWCFLCSDWGNDCWPRGRKELCEINTFSNNASLCEAAGFTYLTRAEGGHHDLCADLSKTTQDACLPPPDFINYDHWEYVGGEHKSTAKSELHVTSREVHGGSWTFCYSQKVKQDGNCAPGGSSFGTSTCDNPKHHHSLIDDVPWDQSSEPHPEGACQDIGGWLSHRGYCTKEFEQGRDGWSRPYTSHVGDCTGNWTTFYGRTWRFGAYESADACTFGCSDHQLFEQEADEATCTARATCTESCAYCASHFREEESDIASATMCIDRSPHYAIGLRTQDEWADSELQTALSECTKQEGELFEYDKRVDGVHRRTYFGCRINGILDKESCMDKLANASLLGYAEWHECGHYGDPHQPMDAAGHKRCRYHTWNEETHEGYDGYPTEIAPEQIGEDGKPINWHDLRHSGTITDEFTYAVMDRLGCHWRSWARCRDDERVCEIMKDAGLPNVESYPILGALNCSREELDTTSAECTAMGGKCSDDDLGSFGWDEATHSTKFGCVLPFDQFLNRWGDPDCHSAGDQVHWTRIGCADLNVDFAACQIKGGQWRHRAQSQSECLQDGKVCMRNHWEIDFRPPTEAEVQSAEGVTVSTLECGGCLPQLKKTPAVDVYQWSQAIYERATYDVELTWMPKGNRSVRRLTKRPDHHKLETLIDTLTSRQLGRQQASNFMGEWIPKNALTATIACACDDPGIEYDTESNDPCLGGCAEAWPCFDDEICGSCGASEACRESVTCGGCADAGECRMCFEGEGAIEAPSSLSCDQCEEARVCFEGQCAGQTTGVCEGCAAAAPCASCFGEGGGEAEDVDCTGADANECLRKCAICDPSNPDADGNNADGEPCDECNPCIKYISCIQGSTTRRQLTAKPLAATKRQLTATHLTAAQRTVAQKGAAAFTAALKAGAGVLGARKLGARKLSETIDKAQCFVNPDAETVQERAEEVLAVVAAARSRRKLTATDLIEVVPPEAIITDQHGTRRRRRLSGANTLITAAAPQETAVGILFAGQELSLSVALRGSASFSTTAVNTANSNAEVELKALPAAMMNPHVRSGSSSGCGATSAVSSYDVLTDTCGTVIGQVIADGLAVQTAANLQETVGLCITPRADITQTSDLYPIIDLAIDVGSGILSLPLNIDLTYTSGDYCFSSATTGVSYVLVRRADTYVTDNAQCDALANASPSAPCPPSPPHTGPTVGFSLIVAGDVSTYEEPEMKSKLISAVAIKAGVSSDAVNMIVEAASVRLIFVIEVSSTAQASSVQSIMAAELASPALAAQMFADANVVIEVLQIETMPTVSEAGAPSLIDQMTEEPEPETLPIAIIAGAAGGGGALLCCMLAVLVFFKFRADKKKQRAMGPAKASSSASDITV